MCRSSGKPDGFEVFTLRCCALWSRGTAEVPSTATIPVLSIQQPEALGAQRDSTRGKSSCAARNARRSPALRGWSNMANARSRTHASASLATSS
jgi:hypothetical protein